MEERATSRVPVLILVTVALGLVVLYGGRRWAEVSRKKAADAAEELLSRRRNFLEHYASRGDEARRIALLPECNAEAIRGALYKAANYGETRIVELIINKANLRRGAEEMQRALAIAS